jgi:hypothetical protein
LQPRRLDDLVKIKIAARPKAAAPRSTRAKQAGQ